jgi:hypothetical protein
MRKRIVPGPTLTERSRDSEQGWLDLQEIATVEVTSEDPSFPIEAAFNSEAGSGWRAAEAGDQQIRIISINPPRSVAFNSNSSRPRLNAPTSSLCDGRP